MKRYRLVPDYDTPNRLYIYDMANGQSIAAIIYAADIGTDIVEFLNNRNEVPLNLNDYFEVK